MFIADFLYVNYIFHTHILLMFMLTEYKYLTFNLTLVHFLNHIFGSRKETGSKQKTR